MKRSTGQKLKDFLAFPLRAVTLFDRDKWGLSSLATERYDYVSREVIGYCLDVGCGPHNRFVTDVLGGNGRGIDVFPYDGLTDEQVVRDMTRFPFDDAAFDSVTFIANLNHVPRPQRDAELAEAWRVLKTPGNIVVTMGHPLAELLAHGAVRVYDKLFGTRHDLDAERGMAEGEAYYLTDGEILGRLSRAGFADIAKKYFATQWGLNHLFVGWKR